jgi:hypothetical protein
MVTKKLQTASIQITTKQKSIFTELYNLALSDVHQLHVPVDNALILRCFILTYSTQQQMHSNESYTLLNYIQGDHKVSVRLTKYNTEKYKASPVRLQTFIDTRLTLTPSVIPNSNYVIMASH